MQTDHLFIPQAKGKSLLDTKNKIRHHTFGIPLLAELLYFQTTCVYIHLKMFCCSDVTNTV